MHIQKSANYSNIILKTPYSLLTCMYSQIRNIWSNMLPTSLQTTLYIFFLFCEWNFMWFHLKYFCYFYVKLVFLTKCDSRKPFKLRSLFLLMYVLTNVTICFQNFLDLFPSLTLVYILSFFCVSCSILISLPAVSPPHKRTLWGEAKNFVTEASPDGL